MSVSGQYTNRIPELDALAIGIKERFPDPADWFEDEQAIIAVADGIADLIDADADDYEAEDPAKANDLRAEAAALRRRADEYLALVRTAANAEVEWATAADRFDITYDDVNDARVKYETLEEATVFLQERADRRRRQELRAGRRSLRDYVFTPAELERLPEPEWLIEGVLMRDSIALLYGPPAAGKTFLALEWSASLSAGQPMWLGHKLPGRPSRVLYIAGEGSRGIRRRIAAWEAANEVKVPGADGDAAGARFVVRSVNLLERDSDDWSVLLEIVSEGWDLIVVDTLARSAEGGDENSVKDMGRFVGALDVLREASSGACVLVLHHSTKAGDGFRGSSALSGAADTMIEFGVDGTVRCEKQKDAEPFQPRTLRREDVPGTESCVLVAGMGMGIDIAEWGNRASAAQVWRVLPAREPGKTRAEIEAETGLSGSTVKRVLNELDAESDGRRTPRYTRPAPAHGGLPFESAS